MPMKTQARWWASLGVPVLPLHFPVERDGTLVCSCGGDCGKNAAKHPLSALVRNGLTDATTDLDLIDAWWDHYPNANIGGRTGHVFDLLDIDSEAGMARYGELVRAHGRPEHFGVAQSGRDGVGLHVYVGPGGLKALQQGRTAPNGIDVKGRGGYAVLPPSRHISGRPYLMLTHTFGDDALTGDITWEAFYRQLEVRPQVPVRAPRSSIPIPTDAADAYGAAVLRQALSLVASAGDGARWQTLATEAVPLIARGVDGGCIDRDSAVRELEEAGRAIGLDRREIGRIGSLVDDMIAKGIRNPIHPKDAAAKIGELIASPAGPAPLATRPATRTRPQGALDITGEGAESEDGHSGETSDSDGSGDAGNADYTGDPLTDPWEPPWPLRYSTPPFPIEVMDWIGPEITGLADQLQCSVDLVAMMTLATVSATIRGRIRAEFSPGWEEPLNLYVAVVAEPGETKSPALSRIVAPLREIEADARSQATELIADRKWTKEFVEAEAKKLREAALAGANRDAADRLMAQTAARDAAKRAEDIVVPALPTYLAGDMTPEALIALMAEQGGVLAHLSAEGALLDTIVGGRYSNGVAQLSGLLMAHDGREPIKVHRRSAEDLVVDNPCLTIGLAVQSDVLKKLGANDAAVGRGLVARFLFSIPSSLVGHRDMSRRRSGEEFRGFWALVRGVERLASSSPATGSGDIGPSIQEKRPLETARERWRIAGTPVEESQASGDIGPSIQGSSTLRGTPCQPSERPSSGDIGYMPLKYRFGESSSSLVDQYRHDLEPRRAAETGDLGDVGPWANKLDGQLIRLASVLQLVRDAAPGADEAMFSGSRAHNPRNPDWEVGVEAVAAARVLVDYLIAHSVEAHAVISGTDGGAALTRAKQVLGWVQANGAAEFTAHEAERSLRKRALFREQGSVHRGCDTLLRLGWIREVPPESGKVGRPSRRFVVHPDAFTAE